MLTIWSSHDSSEEPARSFDIRFQVLLLPRKPKADLELANRFADLPADMHMPAAILVWAAAREDAEVHQQQTARRGQAMRWPSRESRLVFPHNHRNPKERLDNAATMCFGDRRIAWRNIFDLRGHATLQTQMLEQEILDRL